METKGEVTYRNGVKFINGIREDLIVTPEYAVANEFCFAARQDDKGNIIALNRYAFTIGLIRGMDLYSIHERWCYPDMVEALMAYSEWDGLGDPPGNWVKHKGPGIDRLNPNLDGTDV